MHIVGIGLRGVPHVIGGIEVVCENLYPEIVKRDPDTSVTLLIRRGYTPERNFVWQGVQVIALWSPIFWGVDTLIHTFLAILYARLFLRPSIVHLHGIGPAFFAPLSRLLGMRTVVTHHSADYRRPKWDWRGQVFLKLGEASAAKSAQAVVCVSNAVRADFIQRYPGAAGRTSVIRNASGLDLDVRRQDTGILEQLGIEEKGYILAAGRLEATKAFHELIEAFGSARTGGRKLVIAGADAGNIDYARDLMSAASDRIVFAGYRNGAELQQLFRDAALFVHPSHMEGYGLVVSEALCAGTPVLASDIPPHREFGLAERCYVPAGDVPALAAALSVPDYETYRSTGAIDAQRRDGWARVAGEYAALFAAIMRRGGRAPGDRHRR